MVNLFIIKLYLLQLPKISWICTLLATLRFQQMIVPPKLLQAFLIPYVTLPISSSSSLQSKLVSILLPPWQQIVVLRQQQQHARVLSLGNSSNVDDIIVVESNLTGGFNVLLDLIDADDTDLNSIQTETQDEESAAAHNVDTLEVESEELVVQLTCNTEDNYGGGGGGGDKSNIDNTEEGEEIEKESSRAKTNSYTKDIIENEVEEEGDDGGGELPPSQLNIDNIIEEGFEHYGKIKAEANAPPSVTVVANYYNVTADDELSSPEKLHLDTLSKINIDERITKSRIEEEMISPPPSREDDDTPLEEKIIMIEEELQVESSREQDISLIEEKEMPSTSENDNTPLKEEEYSKSDEVQQLEHTLEEEIPFSEEGVISLSEEKEITSTSENNTTPLNEEQHINHEERDVDIDNGLSSTDEVRDVGDLAKAIEEETTIGLVLNDTTHQQQSSEANLETTTMDDYNSNESAIHITNDQENVIMEKTTVTLPPLVEASLSRGTSMHEIQYITTKIASLLVLLSVIYSIAVHAFLSSFHERHFSERSHWRAICIRVGLATFVVLFGMQQWQENDVQLGMRTIFNLTVTLVSMNLIVQTRQREVNGPMPQYTSLEGKVIFITGSNAGIGRETARQLYNFGATILMGCRSESRAIDAMQNIDPLWQQQSGEQRRMHYINLDLTSISSIHDSVKALEQISLPLHMLYLNAGVMRNRREETVDGLEMTMAANHLGHFLLTNLLLPKMRETAIKENCPSRVITVSSSLYHTAGSIDVSDLQCQWKRYSLFEQYAQSKLANILFSLELGRREKNLDKYQPAPAEQRQETKPLPTMPTTKAKKKLRPKLLPVSPTENPDESDGEGLGYDEVVTSVSSESLKTKTPRLAENGDHVWPVSTPTKKTKKKLRPKLTPIDTTDVQDDDGDGTGLGFHHIVTPLTSKQKLELWEYSSLQATGKADDEKVSNQRQSNDECNKRECLVKSMCLHPGLVRTDVVRDMPWWLYYPNKLFSLLMVSLQKTPGAGAYTSVYCAIMNTNKMDKEGCCYFVNSEPQQLDKCALNKKDAKELWDLSSELVSRQ